MYSLSEYQVGERVRVVVEGEVYYSREKVLGIGDQYEGSLISSNDVQSIERIEPSYKTGDVVKDANGNFWKYTAGGNWLEFGTRTVIPFGVPVRPLTKVN